MKCTECGPCVSSLYPTSAILNQTRSLHLPTARLQASRLCSRSSCLLSEPLRHLSPFKLQASDPLPSVFSVSSLLMVKQAPFWLPFSTPGSSSSATFGVQLHLVTKPTSLTVEAVRHLSVFSSFGSAPPRNSHNWQGFLKAFSTLSVEHCSPSWVFSRLLEHPSGFCPGNIPLSLGDFS